MDDISPGASPESTVAPRKGRPLRSLWSIFTNKPNAHILAEGPKAPCKHCNTVVLHHNKTACVERHLRKCPPFVNLMASQPEEKRPDWFARPQKKMIADAASGDTKAARMRATTPEIVSLNVGGTIFQTTKDTLLQHENSLFHSLLLHPPASVKDSYFIDINPKAFEAVLDYLRYDELCLDDMTTWERKKVLKSFAYLKLPVPNIGWDPSTGVISTRNGFSPGGGI
ncbi:hypothetical protein ACHHYP_00136 [Achlya hypogyna]|uniref:BTB domain-containing protein n=1 Tax=Achlya hypogyna TaxID=1202772 RepID=A0A1V9ZBH3_ACHHY|nr:hypothetical protein ACHHYP_00136 [Achlya hypogyna]